MYEERLEDLPLLVRHLLDSAGYADTTVSLQVTEVFCTYSWPGNIRELRNVLVRAAMLSSEQMITTDHLPLELLPSESRVVGPPVASFHIVGQELIRQVLQGCHGNISRAAQRLGIHRTTLYRRLRQYRLAGKAMTEEGSSQL